MSIRPATGPSQASAPGETKPGRFRTKEWSVADLVDQVDNGIVAITLQDAAGNDSGMGSGFLIDSTGLVATNFHVIKRCSMERKLDHMPAVHQRLLNGGVGTRRRIRL